MEYETADILDIKSSDLTYETLGTRHQISSDNKFKNRLRITNKGRETDISYVQRQ